jgi:hypothetical protein
MRKRLHIGVGFGHKILAQTWLNVWVPYGVLCVCIWCACSIEVHAYRWEVFQLEIWTWHKEQIHFVMTYLFPRSQVNSNGLNFGPSPFVLIKSVTNIFILCRHCVAMHGHSPHNVHPHSISCNQLITSIFLCVTNFLKTKDFSCQNILSLSLAYCQQYSHW